MQPKTTSILTEKSRKAVTTCCNWRIKIRVCKDLLKGKHDYSMSSWTSMLFTNLAVSDKWNYCLQSSLFYQPSTKQNWAHVWSAHHTQSYTFSRIQKQGRAICYNLIAVVEKHYFDWKHIAWLRKYVHLFDNTVLNVELGAVLPDKADDGKNIKVKYQWRNIQRHKTIALISE